RRDRGESLAVSAGCKSVRTERNGVAMYEINIAALGKTLQERAAFLQLDTVPPHMRHRQIRTTIKPFHRTRDDAKAPHAAAHIRAMKDKWQHKRNADHRLAWA